MENNYISIGKITNFFGIKGEAKVGYSNENQIKKAKKVIMLDDINKTELTIKSVRFSKNFAIVKFDGINDINEIVKYKGQRIFISKENALNQLDENEYLIKDLIGCKIYNEQNELLGSVESVATNGSQDLLNIKNLIGQINQVPFVNEFFPSVDIKNKKIIIRVIEGLLS